MDKKMLMTLAVACAGVAILGVFLPWATFSMAGHSASVSGTEGEFKGVFVLILCLLGGAGALLVMLGKTDVVPLDEKALLLVAGILMGIGGVLAITDFLRSFGPASKGLGLILTIAACAGGAACAILASKKATAGD